MVAYGSWWTLFGEGLGGGGGGAQSHGQIVGKRKIYIKGRFGANSTNREH